MYGETQLGAITDWYGLGGIIGVKTSTMAWTLKNRDEMQHRIKLGERTVYRSDPSLRFVQSRLCSLLEPLFDDLPDNDAAIAYRKGITATDVVKRVPHAHTLMTFDIRHYYDSVTLDIIRDCLVDCGMAKSGAKLVGRYCTVRKNGRLTLQQGSPASPVISNIVGHFLLDVPIVNWLKSEYPGVKATYLRYCDNVALFVHEIVPDEFYASYKEWVKSHLLAAGLKTHKWARVADNNPVLHQKFLGMVLNAEARAELALVDRLRATLFNWCREGIKSASEMFFGSQGINVQFASSTLLGEKFSQHARGHIQYIKRLNPKQGLMLEKLYRAARFLDKKKIHLNGQITPAVFYAVKQYKNHAQSLDDYLEQLRGAADFGCAV